MALVASAKGPGIATHLGEPLARRRVVLLPCPAAPSSAGGRLQKNTSMVQPFGAIGEWRLPLARMTKLPAVFAFLVDQRP